MFCETYFAQLMNGLEEGAFPRQENEVILNLDAKIALDVLCPCKADSQHGDYRND